MSDLLLVETKEPVGISVAQTDLHLNVNDVDQSVILEEGVVKAYLNVPEVVNKLTVFEGVTTIQVIDPSGLVIRVEDLELTVYDVIPPDKLLPMSLLTGIDDSNNAWIGVSWTASTATDVAYYEIGLRKDGDAYVSYYVTGMNEFKIYGLLPNTKYWLSIQVVDRLGNTLGFTTEQDITTDTDSVAPSPITSLAISAAFKNIFLTWVNPTDVDFDVVEVWRSDTNDRTLASKIAEVRTTFYGDNVGTGITRYYWLRARDTSGNESTWNPVSVTGGVTETTAQIITVDIADSAVIGTKIADATIDMASKIQGLLPNANLAQITDPAKLADAIVLEAKLAVGAVTEGKIASGAVIGSKLAAETITGDKIAAGTIVGNLIAADAIGATNIVAGAIVAGKIATNAIIAANIQAGAVESDKILANAITSDKIYANAITTAKIATGQITADKLITSEAVITSGVQIQDAIISNAKITDLAVTKLTAGSLTANILFTGVLQTAVSGARIVINGAIATPQIQAYNATVQTVKIAADGSGYFGAWNGTYYPIVWNSAGELALQGATIVDLSVTNAKIGNLEIGNAKLAGGITYDKLSIGTLSAITANLGTVTAGSIVVTTGSDKIWLNDSSDGALNIGGSTKASAPFRVSAAGALVATNATITGAITATSGTFTGTVYASAGSFSGTIVTSNITATGGTIGGFTLGSQSLITPTGLLGWYALGASANLIYGGTLGGACVYFNGALANVSATNSLGVTITQLTTDSTYNARFYHLGTEVVRISSLTRTISFPYATYGGTISSAATLALTGATSVNITATSAGISITAGASMTINAATNIGITAAGGLTLTGTSAVTINTNSTITMNAVVYIAAGKSVCFVGPLHYIHTDGLNLIFHLTGGNAIKFEKESSVIMTLHDNDGVYVRSHNLIIDNGQYFYLDGYGGDSYIRHSADIVSLYAKGAQLITADGSTGATKVSLKGTYTTISSTNLSSDEGAFAINGAYLYWRHGGTSYKVLGTAV